MENKKTDFGFAGNRSSLDVIHSYVHSSQGKVTSLTISVPKTVGAKYCFFTLSDKKDKIRVKMSLDEIAGLSDSVEKNAEWNAYHRWEGEGETSETSLQYNNGFFNAQRMGKKIAMKLTGDERASFKLLLRVIFERTICR